MEYLSKEEIEAIIVKAVLDTIIGIMSVESPDHDGKLASIEGVLAIDAKLRQRFK